MLEALYSEFFEGGFVDRLRDGKFDEALAQESLDVLKEFCSKAKKSEIPDRDFGAFSYMLRDVSNFYEAGYLAGDKRIYDFIVKAEAIIEELWTADEHEPVTSDELRKALKRMSDEVVDLAVESEEMTGDDMFDSFPAYTTKNVEIDGKTRRIAMEVKID